MPALAGRDSDLLVWWVECVSALARLERAAALDVKGMALASNRLKQLANGWHGLNRARSIKRRAVGRNVCHWVNWRFRADAEAARAVARSRNVNDINA